MKRNLYLWIVFGVLFLTSDNYAILGIKAGFGISNSSYKGATYYDNFKLVDIKGIQYNGKIMFTGLPFFDFDFSSSYIKKSFMLELDILNMDFRQKFDLTIKSYVFHGKFKLSVPLIPIVPYAGLGIGKYDLDFESKTVIPAIEQLRKYVDFSDFDSSYGVDAVVGSRFKLMFIPFEPYVEIHYSKIYTPSRYSNIDFISYEIGILISVF